MATLKDKILDFVKTQSEPVLISDIAKGVDYDLTTTQKAVLELHQEGVLFRSVSKGKAFFSASGGKGEGLTPVQTGNARVARTMNSVLGGGPVPIEATVDDDGDEPHKPFDIKLTFTQGKRLKFKDYSIGVPDGFEYKTDFDGRDFAIWMPPTEDPELLDPDGIPTMSPIVLMENAKNDESPSEAFSLVFLKKVCAYAYASALLGQNFMGIVPEVLDTQNIPVVYYRTLMSNYSVHPVFNEYMKGFTLRIDTEIDPKDDAKDPERAHFNSVLASWIDTIELRVPCPARKSLDNPEFFKGGVSKDAIARWGKYAAEWSNQSTALCTQAIQYEVYKYNATHPVWSFTACKSKLLLHLEEEANYYNKMLAETLNCVEKLYGSCSDDMFLFLCKQALEIAAIDRCSRTIDDDEITVKTVAPQIRSKLKKISQQIEQKKQTGKQNLKEEMAKEEAAKYGIAISDLEKHRAYLKAKEKYERAKTADDYASTKRELIKIADYLDTSSLIDACDFQAEILRAKCDTELQESREYYKYASTLMGTSFHRFVYAKPDGSAGSLSESSGIHGFTNIKQLACTEDAIIGLRNDGTCITTKPGSTYAHITECNTWRGIVSISAGDHQAVGLRADGTCVTNSVKWNTGYGGGYSVSGFSDVIQLACASSFCLGLQSNGNVQLASSSESCRVSGVTSWKNIVMIAAGPTNFGGAVGLTREGKLLTAGFASANEIKPEKGIVQLLLHRGAVYALYADGTVGGGIDNSKASRISGNETPKVKEKNVIALASAGTDLYVLTEDGIIHVYSKKNSNSQPTGIRIFESYKQLVQERAEVERKAREERELEEKRKQEEAARVLERRSQGLCQHCGGTFKKGLLGIKCTSCGKRKDY